MDDPFDDKKLAHIFQTDAMRPNVLRRRESITLEFKENFHLAPNNRAAYGKSMAAYSNKCGGYLVFGIKDKPHEMVGMTNSSFDNLDPNVLTQFLNNHFEPSINWRHQVHVIAGKRFGLIYTYECKCKPIMCVRQVDMLRESDIYYRYSGESKVIRAFDLHQVIRERIDAERKDWRDLLLRTARTDPSSTYLLDIESGRAEGADRRFLLDETLLNKVKFIHEGHFVDGGEPALKVIGDVDVVRVETIPGPAVQFDPAKDCPHYEKDVVKKLRERLGDSVRFNGAEKELTGKMIRDVVKSHSIPTPTKMYYRSDMPQARASYGEEFVNWVESQYKTDQEFFYKAKLGAAGAEN